MEEEVLGKAYDARLMRRLLGYMRPYRALVFFSLLFLLAQSVLQVLNPLLTRLAVDNISGPKGALSILPSTPGCRRTLGPVSHASRCSTSRCSSDLFLPSSPKRT